jgi:hypothetical protein
VEGRSLYRYSSAGHLVERIIGVCKPASLHSADVINNVSGYMGRLGSEQRSLYSAYFACGVEKKKKARSTASGARDKQRIREGSSLLCLC